MHMSLGQDLNLEIDPNQPLDDRLFQALYQTAQQLFPDQTAKAEAWARQRIINLGIQKAKTTVETVTSSPIFPFVIAASAAWFLTRR